MEGIGQRVIAIKGYVHGKSPDIRLANVLLVPEVSGLNRNWYAIAVDEIRVRLHIEICGNPCTTKCHMALMWKCTNRAFEIKKTEIAKRLNAIIAQVLPFLAQEHQQQVATAVERAKQVTMTELNAIIGQQQQQGLQQLLQQIHAQQLPHGAHGPGLPMGPHPGLPGMGPAAGLLGFGAGLGGGVPGAPGGPHPAVAGGAHPLLKPADLHVRDPQDLKRPGSTNAEERLNSVSPGDRDKYRSRSPAEVDQVVKRRKEDKLGHVSNSTSRLSETLFRIKEFQTLLAVSGANLRLFVKSAMMTKCGRPCFTSGSPTDTDKAARGVINK
ncbi:hypothetical protein NQ314_018205 [Rhamnusium bicolor]|uniref:Groucho/TLE N-terminal Q-rich domain-containing protein n=1 Tax=Rhamnusium bicolor TaxID=1586634 RepID=A0AAV8WSW6_9CUCU|nr:hypothetical protein NQ314_018205 [Rhamnusium bicolor]